MNTAEIIEILETNPVTRNTFAGVFAADQLPKERLQHDRWFIICNCCPISLPGKHWVVIFCEGGELQFFDSFGLAPEHYPGIAEFINTQEMSDVVFNNEQFQSIESDACGHYCIFVAFCRSAGESMETVTMNLRCLDRDSFLKYIVINLL